MRAPLKKKNKDLFSCLILEGVATYRAYSRSDLSIALWIENSLAEQL